MKQFLKLFFCFVPFSILIYSFFAFFWAEYSPKIISSNLKSKEIYTTPGSLYFRTKELKKYNDLDVLFLGSSHAYRGFDTRFYENYGLNVFNLGSSSQTQIQTNILVERYLDSLNPKIVIYEVYPGTFMNDGVESSVDLLINGENDMRSIEMAFNINSITTYNALLYSLVRDFIGSFDTRKKQTQQGVDTYVKGGFVERNISYFKKKYHKKKEMQLSQLQLKAFDNALSIIKNKQNIKIIFVYAPITSSLYNSYTNNRVFDSIIMNKSEKYLNFNLFSDLNDSIHFYDSHHLNQKGVKKFNKKLIELLDDEFKKIRIQN